MQYTDSQSTPSDRFNGVADMSELRRTPSDSFLAAYSLLHSTSSVRRHRSAANLVAAVEEAKQQLALEGIDASSRRDDEEVEQLLQTHRSTLNESLTQARQADALRNREETELHRVVSGLMKKTEELGDKLKEETSGRLAAQDRETRARMELIEADEELSTANSRVSQLSLRVQQLELENRQLHSELASARLHLTVVQAPKRRPRSHHDLSRSQSASAQPPQEVPPTLALLQYYEEKLRQSFIAHEIDLNLLLREHSSFHRRLLELEIDNHELRLDKIRQAQVIDSLKATIHSLEVTTLHLHHGEVKSETSTVVSHQAAVSSTVSRRSVSPKVGPLGHMPWYPPSTGTNFHTPQQYASPIRAKSPKILSQASPRDSSPSPSRTPPKPTPTPRRVPPQATPRSSSYARLTNGHRREAAGLHSAHTQTPDRVPSVVQRRSPSRESVSRTLEHLTGLIEELRTWQEEGSP